MPNESEYPEEQLPVMPQPIEQVDETEEAEEEPVTENQVIEELIAAPEPESDVAFPEAQLSEEDEAELFGTDEPDSESDFSDITGLSKQDEEDLFGTGPIKKKPKVRRMQRVTRYGQPPSLGQIGY